MILYLDLVSGISGDMCLGALTDLGVAPQWLEAQLTPLFQGFSLRTETVFRHHLRAANLFVDVTDDKTHRHYAEIKGLIRESGLSEYVKKNSLAAFKKIAGAEAHIHGKDIETVHFHEIGGIDSMVDIMGTFLGIEKLGITKVVASRVPLGTGFVACAHGRIPVPVPATLAILKGIPVTGSDATTEIVTPTGAALVATLAADFGPMPDMAVQSVGYGAGKRDTGASVPNLLRMVLGRPFETDTKKHGPGIRTDRVTTIKTNLDDMSPELLGHFMDLAMAEGALDVAYAPVFMKKNRPGIQVEVMCRPDDRDGMIRLLLTQTTAIGVRHKTWDRAVLHRQAAWADTRFGRIRVKRITDPDGRAREVPEYDVLRELAKEHDMPLKDIYAQVLADLNLLDTEKAR